MAEKWKCPNCGGINPPNRQSCLACNHARTEHSLPKSKADIPPKIQGISDHPILSRINPFFHGDALQVIQDHSKNDERVVWAGNIGQYGEYSTIRFGYLILLKDRLIRVLFDSDVNSGNLIASLAGLVFTYGILGPRSKSIRPAHKIKYTYRSGKGGSGDLAEYVLASPSYSLTQNEITHKRVEEFLLKSLNSTEQFNDEIENEEGKKLVEVVLRFLPDQKKHVVFYSEDEARDFLQALASQKASGNSEKGNIVEQLKQLADLRQAGILTDEEFEKAKGKLLNSLE